MITLLEAQQHLQTSAYCDTRTEKVELAQALGRVASADVHAGLSIPPNDNSAMDGFAVSSSDVTKLGIVLPISQRIPAGSQPEPLKAGTAVRIFTGGAMPAKADAVVIQENTDYDQQKVVINKLTKPGDNVRPYGQDISEGSVVVAGGRRLTPIDLALLASVGKSTIEVYKPLRVAIFSTGDELVNPGQELKPGQIYNSNRPMLMALCEQLGFIAVDCGIVEDTLGATKAALLSAAKRADVILSSGGVSVGEEDHIKAAVEDLGSLEMWKVQMKPGKPVAFGKVADTPFLGLPGNPVSSYVVFQLLGVPLMNSLQGCTTKLPRSYSVISGFTKKTSDREDYIRARINIRDDGKLIAQPFANSSSGVMSSLAWADGLIRQRIDSAIEIGAEVEFLPLHEGML